MALEVKNLYVCACFAPPQIKHREKNVDSSSTNGRKQPLTLNIVLHEWLEPRLTHSIAECSGGEGEEVTIFVGNEFFVDKKLLRERGHVLVPTGGTKKACLPQVIFQQIVFAAWS